MSDFIGRLGEIIRQKQARIEQFGLDEWYGTLIKSLQAPGGRLFVLDPEQCARLQEWQATHVAVYTGAIGGRYEYRFTPTSIGDMVQVHDSMTGQTLDLTSVTTG